MKTRILVTLVAALLVASATGFAAEPEGWKFEITPYAWLAGLEGDGTINGQDFDFDKSFSDIVDAVDVGGSLLGIAQYNRFILWGRVDFFSLDTDEMDLEDQPAGGRLETDLLLTECAAGYQVDGWMEGQTFDILLGVRSLTIENELTVYGRGTVSTDDRPEEWEKETRVDGLLILRPSIPLFPSKIDGLRLNATLAIGAGDSDLVYEMNPEIQYQITDHVAARLGYRTVGYKLKGDDNEDNELNFNLAGLIVGLGVTF